MNEIIGGQLAAEALIERGVDYIFSVHPTKAYLVS